MVIITIMKTIIKLIVKKKNNDNSIIMIVMLVLYNEKQPWHQVNNKKIIVIIMIINVCVFVLMRLISIDVICSSVTSTSSSFRPRQNNQQHISLLSLTKLVALLRVTYIAFSLYIKPLFYWAMYSVPLPVPLKLEFPLPVPSCLS